MYILPIIKISTCYKKSYYRFTILVLNLHLSKGKTIATAPCTRGKQKA